jgi:hypothetical protein
MKLLKMLVAVMLLCATVFAQGFPFEKSFSFGKSAEYRQSMGVVWDESVRLVSCTYTATETPSEKKKCEAGLYQWNNEVYVKFSSNPGTVTIKIMLSRVPKILASYAHEVTYGQDFKTPVFGGYTEPWEGVALDNSAKIVSCTYRGTDSVKKNCQTSHLDKMDGQWFVSFNAGPGLVSVVVSVSTSLFITVASSDTTTCTGVWTKPAPDLKKGYRIGTRCSDVKFVTQPLGCATLTIDGPTQEWVVDVRFMPCRAEASWSKPVLSASNNTPPKKRCPYDKYCPGTEFCCRASEQKVLVAMIH